MNKIETKGAVSLLRSQTTSNLPTTKAAIENLLKPDYLKFSNSYKNKQEKNSSTNYSNNTNGLNSVNNQSSSAINRKSLAKFSQNNNAQFSHKMTNNEKKDDLKHLLKNYVSTNNHNTKSNVKNTESNLQQSASNTHNKPANQILSQSGVQRRANTKISNTQRESLKSDANSKPRSVQKNYTKNLYTSYKEASTDKKQTGSSYTNMFKNFTAGSNSNGMLKMIHDSHNSNRDLKNSICKRQTVDKHTR